MMKSGAAAAVLAIASMSAAVSAQDAGSCGGAWARCKGPEPADNMGCCLGFQCVQKNEFYAQCRPADKAVPQDWPMGTVIAEKSPAMTEDDVADDEEPAEEEDVGAVIDDESVDDADAAGDEEDDNEDVDGDDEAADGDAAEDEETEYDLDDEEDDAEDLEEDPGTEDALVESLPDDDVEEEEPMDELAAEGPLADDMDDDDEYMISYMSFVGKDYYPDVAPEDGVAVEDIPGGSAKVASPMECEDFCAATEGCNAASYYLDGSPYGGKNCWLKTLDLTCELPMGAVDDANAVYIMQLDPACVEEEALAPMGLAMAPGMAPMEAMEPDAAAPGGVDGLDDDENDDEYGGAIPRVTPGDSEDNAGGAVNVRGAVIAMIVAGAAAFF